MRETLRRFRDEDLVELIRLLKHPGWTTPAEFMLSGRVVEQMVGHVRSLKGLRETLSEAGQDIVGHASQREAAQA